MRDSKAPNESTDVAQGSPDHPTQTASYSGASGAGPVTEKSVCDFPQSERDYYSVLGEQGRGGLGRVIQIWDRRLGRTIAVKELLDPSSQMEWRFMREARLTARLEHPAIVPIYDVGRWPGGKPFYAMKLVSGRSLKDLIHEKTTLDERLALVPSVVQVAEAMAYAHSRRVIHRDLKPSNVMVGEFGETIVIDWGLAKDLAEPSP